uniref:Flavin-containing monooxygenase n=1 Tax=Setaria digitata TaxID=48799 RepID=A0A915PS43_9BILA
MKSTVINSSKELTAFSDFVPPPEMPNFMSHVQMLAYLRLYAKHFDLLRHIHLKHEVLAVERNEKYDENGRWNVTYRNINNDMVNTEIFDGVLLCCGHHTIPHWPQPFLGQDRFHGEIIHSHDYREPLAYSGKNIVVVGFGNSAVDIAVDVSEIADEVYLSTRTGAWVLGRTWDRGEPADAVFLSRYIQSLRNMVPFWILNKAIQNQINRRFDHGRFGLTPKHGPLEAHNTVNDCLPSRLASGTIVVS